MASHPEDRHGHSQEHQQEPKKEAGQASESNQNPPSAGGHPPAPGYPPAMGYPHSMGYPPGHQPGGYPPHHHQPPPPPQAGSYYEYPAPNNAGYNPQYYPYAQAPPADYYNGQTYQMGPAYQSSRNFARGILIGMIFLVIFMCMASIITFLVLRPEIPVFHLETFTVSNFNASSAAFTAAWEANVTVENPNTKLKLYFDQIEGFVYYGDEDVLGSAYVQPFYMETKTKSGMQAKISTNNTGKDMVGSWVVEKLEKERGTGSVSFNLRFGVFTTFRAGTWWTRHATLRVFCDDLKVAFVGSTGNGNLASKPEHCLVYA